MEVQPLGNQQEIMDKLSAVHLAGLDPTADKFYNAFAALMEGKPFNDVGTNMRWEKAKDAVQSEMSPIELGIIDMGYDAMVDVLAPNQELAAAAKTTRAELKKMLDKK